MQFFGSLFNDNKALTITLIMVGGIVAVAILIFLYHLVFGRRLHMAGGRPRQPRLGVLDAFDLDRQRQLVLIRRDNVEHLIMIGGPNDLVIESAFVRMQPNLPMANGRDKDLAAGVIAPVIPMALPPNATAGAAPTPSIGADIPGSAQTAPPAAGPSAGERAIPPLDLTDPISSVAADLLADLPAPAPVATPSPTDPPTTAVGAGTTEPGELAPTAPPARPSRFATTFPPRQLGASGTGVPRPPLSSLRTPTTATSTRPVSPGPRPFPSAPLTRGTSAASLRRDPVVPPAAPSDPLPSPVETKTPEAGGAEAFSLPPPVSIEPQATPVEPAPATAPPAPPPARSPSETKQMPVLPTTLDTIESLEEEMAKLLGRPASGSGKG